MFLAFGSFMLSRIGLVNGKTIRKWKNQRKHKAIQQLGWRLKRQES
jgi:hypothetical protein